MKIMSLVALGLAIAIPAQAADSLSKGCAAYNSGRYNEALGYLQDTVSKKPRVWQGHYYLGHTYLAMGDKMAALQQYQLCEMCNPTPEVMAACQNVASRIASTSTAAGRRSMPSYSAIGQASYINQKKTSSPNGSR